MPTASRIPEESFRLGAGRYIQGYGVIEGLGEECLRLSKNHPIVVGGRTALSIARERVENALSRVAITPEFYVYEGVCSDEGVEAIEACARGKFDLVIGVGGGTVMDAAKYLAVKMGVPVINIPTASATCAAYTPLSVCYKKGGFKDRTEHHKTEVGAVIADMDILAAQPPRLFLAGAYDAMAKLYELRQRMLGVDESECDIGLLSSYHLSGFMLDHLVKNLHGCLEDLRNGESTKRLYDSIFTAVAICGTVSGLARGANQTALAHKVYEIMRNDFADFARPYLHGELVALGLVLQVAYNGEGDPVEFARELRSNSIPASISDLGIADGGAEEIIFDRLVRSTAMAGTSADEQNKLREAIKYIL